MRADHEAEFRVFAASRWPRLVRTAYLLTGDPHDAEDLAQTVLVKAFRSWRRVQRADNVDAYLRRAPVTSNASRFRKRRVAESLTAEVPETAHPPGENAATRY
jgi:DNA-directed RNA polymerase specialized sigma24 family protein